MAFLDDLIKTAIDTGKKAIRDEVKEQTENAIENVSKKVSSTVKNAGSAVENTVKTSIDNIGKPKEEVAESKNVTTSSSMVIEAQSNTASIESPTTVAVADDIGQTAFTQSESVVTTNSPVMTTKETIQNPEFQQTITIEKNSQDSNTSIANDVANIFEKKDIMSREDVSKTAGVIETTFAQKINEVTDALNAAYDKDTTANDNTTSVLGSLNHFLDAAKNIGTKTDNQVGQMLNETFKDAGEAQDFNEARKTLVDMTQNVQDTLDNYKNVGK